MTKLPTALTQALSQAVTNLNKIPSPECGQSSKKHKEPMKVIIGLACPKVWEIASQDMGIKRTMPESQQISEALSQFVQNPEQKNNRNKGKQPME